MSKTLKRIETMLQEAAAKGTWGGIEIELKNGRPTIIRQTIQTRADEDTPDASTRR